MAKRLAELGALQDAVSNDESSPKRLALAGYIRGLFLDWSANPYNPLSRLTARGRLLGYFWDSGAIGLSMNFADQNYLVKDGTVQSKSFNQIVNFSRTTNATVTNSAGLITYAPHNLLTHSEQFDNAAWNKLNTTVSANLEVAPNGTQTADTLNNSSGGGADQIYQTITLAVNNVYTFSLYAKYESSQYIRLRITNGVTGSPQAFYDILNGTLGSIGAGISASITPVGNNWYRLSCTVTADIGGSSNITIFNNDINSAASQTINKKSKIWGAQLEIGSTATTYNSTTVKNLLGYSELFDNAAWTKSNSFVQTNLLTYSEAFDNAAWVKLNSSITSNTIAAPNSYQTADTLTSTSGGSADQIYQTINLATNNKYTFSVYVKYESSQFVIFRVTNGITGSPRAWFDVQNGTVGTVNSGLTSSITTVGEGWYRCTISGTADVGGNSNITILNADSNNSTTQTINKKSYIWGAQLVQGSDAGAYRRTDSESLPCYYPNHNGVVCAEQLHGTSANGTILESYEASGAPMTFSVWMRRITGTGNVDITMDTGVTWTTQAITTSWARYSITSTPAAGARTAGIRLVTSGDIIQVFGGQVSPSASLDPYVLNAAEAPTAAAYYGARFDYDPVTLQPKGLLIEEQRSNLLLNATLAGTNLATQNVTVTAVAHTLSFYGTGSITLSGTASATLTGTGAYPTRSTLTFTPTAGTLTLTVSGTVQYAQLEIGSFATSFIPTAASQVTRAADVATIQGSNFYSWVNQNAGSLYAQFITPASGNRNIIALDDNTANNNIRLRTEGTDPYLKQAWVGTEQVALDLGTVASNTIYKIAASYQINDYAGVIANGTVGTDTLANTPIITMARLGTDQAGAYLNGTIKTFTYYPQKLSDSVLKGLTA